MNSAIAPTPEDGYGWRMTDSDRLDAAVNRAARRRLARERRSQPRPFSAALAELQISKHMTGELDVERADQLQAEADARADREWWERKAEVMMGRLPALYRKADFPRTEWGMQARQWVTDYRNGSRRSLVILGTVGTGKTWVSAAIARALMVDDRPVPTTLITVPDLFGHLRQSVGHDLGVDLAQFTTAPVLILDDLGQELQSPFTTDQLFRLAHARSHAGLPTIVTSNLSGETIKEKYETRTVQRLFGGAALIQIPGESRRELPF